MTRRFYILEDADREIEEQVSYYAQVAGASVADRFYSTLKRTFASLLEAPARGRFFRSSHPALVGIRVWLVHGFPVFVYYREVVDGIEVVHVPRRGVGHAVGATAGQRRRARTPHVQCTAMGIAPWPG